MTALADAALSAATINLFYVAYLDFNGDELRATTYPGGITFGASQTGDDDLDGETFIHVPATMVEVSAVAHAVTGSDEVRATLSGIPGPDDDLLDTIDSRANWQGRIGRLWHGTHDGMGGSIVLSAYYTGYMVQASVGGDPQGGIRVSVTLENYLASISEARNRTYQDQERFNSSDKTAARIRAAANGVKGSGGIGFGYAAGGGGGAFDASQVNDFR